MALQLKDIARCVFATRLHSARLALRLTQEELSNRTGVAVSSISHIENGHRSTTIWTASMLADGVGQTLVTLLSDRQPTVASTSEAVNYTRVFARRMREIRECRGMSQKQLAMRMGITRHYVSRVERGAVSNPTLDLAVSASRALNVELVDLFYSTIGT